MHKRNSPSHVGIVAMGCLVFTGGLGCASTPSADTEAGPDPAGGPDDVEAVPEAEPVDIHVARKLVDTLTASWPATTEPQLLTPASLDDAERILKLDQLTLFGAGVKFARTLEGVQAKALEAQIELAWGESYMTLMEVLLALTERLEERLAELQNGEPRVSDATETQQWLQHQIAVNERLAEALQLLSIEHVTNGSARADEVIAEHPDSYLGYRVAADYHRIVRDWKRFASMETKIEALNAKSNGLVFVRGAAAFQRDGDPQAAAVLFRQALQYDPAFVRAQAHLVVIQDDLGPMRSELENLAKLNANHQLVLATTEIVDWLGRSGSSGSVD